MARVTTRVAVIATIALALAAAGCGGSPGARVAQVGSTAPATTSTTSAASAQVSRAVGFAECMRSSGVPSFPDPTSSGGIPKESLQQLGISSSRYAAAQRACRHLLPNGGRPPDQAQQQRVLALGVEFARCVRSHGVPGFPDPGADGRIPDPATAGIDQGSPKFRAANQACARYRPPYMPSNAAYASWARAHPNGQ
jgi:hypothetical protein